MGALGGQSDCSSPGRSRMTFKYIKERNWGGGCQSYKERLGLSPFPFFMGTHLETPTHSGAGDRRGIGVDTQEAMTHP